MKKKKKNKNLRKKKFIILGVMALLVLGFQGLRAATYNFHGFMWMGNNTYSDRVSGDATIGMVSLRGKTADNKTYGVILNESSDGGKTKLLTGEAWMGIGSKNGQFKNFKEDDYSADSKITSDTDIKGKSLGWIRFNQGFPPENCFGAGDCYAARWNKKEGTANGSLEGYLSGWAKFSIGGYGTETGSVQWNKITDGTSSPATSNFLNYPEVWVHFKAPSNIYDYACDPTNDKHNYVCVDNLGRLSGFAWSSGSDFNSLNNNPGFGWIGFNQDSESQSLAFLSSETTNSPDLSYFCSTRLTSGESVVCSNGSNQTFEFSAYYKDSSIDPKSPINNSFQWKCSPSSAVKVGEGEKTSCSYKEAGVYAPTLKIINKDNKIIECASQATVRITDDLECWVLVRKADSTSEDDFVDQITLERGSTAEAKVVRPCIKTGVLTWETDGITHFSGGSMMTLGLNPNGTVTTVGAKIDAQVCTPAKILTSDSIEWR